MVRIKFFVEGCIKKGKIKGLIKKLKKAIKAGSFLELPGGGLMDRFGPVGGLVG